ncbi:hypothetical protein [Streptomyces longwoodensis]|uniref:hypothetical protein n=1 Tax=Streptomyces longwoodensis TaxID=68231 RepID=UPI003F4CE463
MADSCHSLGLDPRPVIAAAATKPFGFMPFYPGPVVGGHAGRLADAGAQVEYLDPLVPSARLAGAVRTAVTDPGATDWDLAVIHIVHPGTDLSWLDADRTLDVGHRLDAVAAAR